MRNVAGSRQPPLVATGEVFGALPPALRFVLRGGPPVMAAAGGALGLSLSTTACRAVVNQSWAALWLGPDEQLLLGPELPAGGLPAESLKSALRGRPHSLVDVSHRQTALEIRGPHATTVLSSGCPLDLDLAAFPVGMCTRTVLAKAEVVLWRTEQDIFHLEVWRSFAAYVSSFLTEAAREV
jgi:sarcosine oxidase subunit gamma